MEKENQFPTNWEDTIKYLCYTSIELLSDASRRILLELPGDFGKLHDEVANSMVDLNTGHALIKIAIQHFQGVMNEYCYDDDDDMSEFDMLEKAYNEAGIVPKAIPEGIACDSLGQEYGTFECPWCHAIYGLSRVTDVIHCPYCCMETRVKE